MAWESNRPTHVPTHVRQACLARDGNRCVHPLNDGSRCTATTKLEAAHLPGRGWTKGEATTVDMVRTLCHWHHNRETQAEAARARRRKPSAKHPNEKHPGLN